MRRWSVLCLLSAGLLASAPGRALDAVSLVEDWTEQAAGSSGVPAGWSAYETPGGRPRYDFTVVSEDGVRGLRVRSRDDHSTIAKEVHVDLGATPILEWSWKIVTLPAGGDVRRKETSDLTGHVLVTWPRMPALLRTRLIGYVWDATAPAGAVVGSRKTRLVTFFVLRSGPADVGRWIVERRNVREDYARAFGEEPSNPRAVAISIDTNDTHSTAEAVIGRIAFVGDGRPSR
jgi:Protein of unknown function (DUF3047)